MPRTLVLGLCAGYFLVFLDVTVVNVALPQIGSDLRAGQLWMAGVVNAYTLVLAALLLGVGQSGLPGVVDGCGLALAALLLPSGVGGVRWGHRPVVVLAFLCFFLGSLAYPPPPTIELLVAARAPQGVGAAATMAGPLAM